MSDGVKFTSTPFSLLGVSNLPTLLIIILCVLVLKLIGVLESLFITAILKVTLCRVTVLRIHDNGNDN